jgi:cytochrome c55X
MPWRLLSVASNKLSRVKARRHSSAQAAHIMHKVFGMLAAAGMQILGMPAYALAGEAGAPAFNVGETVRLVRQDCGSCHGMTLQGGLGTPLTREALAGQSAETLAVIILHGRHGTAMPPWKSLLSEAQAHWIAEQLLAGFPEEMQQ